MHAKARLEILPFEKSGRTVPVLSGMRAHASFGRQDLHLCQIRIEGAESAATGTRCEITMAFVAVKGLGDRLAAGAKFDLLDENRVIARGTITEDLRKVSFLKRLGL